MLTIALCMELFLRAKAARGVKDLDNRNRKSENKHGP